MNPTKPSKSERKRRQQELQALGEQLIDLDDDLLDRLPLGKRLRVAIADVRRMKSHEAVRRQKQYIGKLMRDVDPAPIRALLDRLQADDRRQKRIFKNAERWRDRFIVDGRSTLEAFAGEYDTDPGEISALLGELEAAHSDRDERTLSRKLFRAIHAALVAQSADG